MTPARAHPLRLRRRFLAPTAGMLLLAAACSGQATPSTSPTASSAASPTAVASASATPGAVTSPPEPTAGGSPTAATGGAFDPSHINLALVPVARGLDSPVFATGAGDGSGRLFIVEQAGRIRILGADGQLAVTPFLDISSEVLSGGEQGLLGLAFHPDYASNGRFFVDYTARNGDTVVAEFHRRDAATADPGSERILYRIADPYPNHNGGMLAFGPDGYLYNGLGDGGAGGDPRNRAQNLGTLWGKLLRVDVDGSLPYAIPSTNPFGSRAGARPEIFDYGLRNPWRFSFDRQTGDLLIGDVGQGSWEEVDAVPAGQPGGLNFGWRIREGRECYGGGSCQSAGLTPPVYVYSHAFGCAIIGGYVYRGSAFPSLVGGYLFSDECSGRIWAASAAQAVAGNAPAKVVMESGLIVSSFGQDDAGELYLCDLQGGVLYHVTAEAH
ncbi:MAG TPA: PQQ-dependent sugar dehydrogenase [Candidatus Dormibacteraeota bacterium]|nr:PQQ-dependent sugar dehydrogenase [Candidatus Dormibacteraeota bacterium]